MTILQTCEKQSPMAGPLRWGIIGTGAIADDFATALGKSDCCCVINAVGSGPGRAKRFAAKYDLPHAADALDDLLGDDSVDAVYVATPHPMHERHAIAAIEAGKHVLCEKPITMDAAGAERVIAAAHSGGVFLMEAFMYRCHPLIAKVIELVRGGAIGRVQHIDADFCFAIPRDPAHRLFNPALGGGAILDVGGYPVSFARLIAGVAIGQPFAEPTLLTGTGIIGPTGVDEAAAAQLVFDSGITAQLNCAIDRQHPSTAATIVGSAGTIALPDPWLPQSDRHALTTSFELRPNDAPARTFSVSTTKATYALEAELVARAVDEGKRQAPWPAMTWNDTLGNMRVLDQWRQQLGINFAE